MVYYVGDKQVTEEEYSTYIENLSLKLVSPIVYENFDDAFDALTNPEIASYNAIKKWSEDNRSYDYSSYYMIKTNEASQLYLFELWDSGISVIYESDGYVTQQKFLPCAYLDSAILIDNNRIVICNRFGVGLEAEYTYEICKFDNGIIENKDNFLSGTVIEKDEYEKYLEEG